MHQQPRRGRLAAAAFADDAERLALHQVEIDAIDRPHHGTGPPEQALVDRKMLDQASDVEQRLARAAPVAWIGVAWMGVARIGGGDAVHGPAYLLHSCMPSPTRGCRRTRDYTNAQTLHLI